jgi:hypothetical protein
MPVDNATMMNKSVRKQCSQIPGKRNARTTEFGGSNQARVQQSISM